MTRREALAKATVTTTDAATGLLDPERGRNFVIALKDKTALSSQMRHEFRTASTGEIDKLATGSRIIRAATENADDGYRAGATFSQVSYTTQKVRLPWEVTEDVFHENIEGQSLEETLTNEMTTQFGYDLEDLEINGDEADVSGDSAFLSINDGILKQISDAAVAGRNIDASTINSGVLEKSHFFEALYAMPNKYRNQGNLRWIMSPARKIMWWETITDRATNSGDLALVGDGSTLSSPLGIPILEVPAMPDETILLANPRNFVRVVSWQVRKRKVTGATDAELAALDKRFYVFFIKHDVVVEETDAVVRIHTLDAI